MFDKKPIILNFILKIKLSPTWYYKHEYIDGIFRKEPREKAQKRFFFFKILFTFKEGKGERKERETSMCE